jgi:hypothetical protein
MEICRPEGPGEIVDLGLGLLEAKHLLMGVQRAVVGHRASQHGWLRPDAGTRSCVWRVQSDQEPGRRAGCA